MKNFSNKNTENFISYARSECRKYGIRIFLYNTKWIWDDGWQCIGIFSEEEKYIRVAIDYPENQWIEAFVHEFCHFIQMADPDYDMYDGIDLVAWCKREIEYTPKKVTKMFEEYYHDETDCNRRAVKMIRKFDLPIDVGEYTSAANIQMMTYTVYYLLRQDVTSKNDIYQHKMKNLFGTRNILEWTKPVTTKKYLERLEYVGNRMLNPGHGYDWKEIIETTPNY